MVNLNLIRHGKTLWNLDRRIQGREDIPLAERGKAQVVSWCLPLGKISLDLVLSSPMVRATQTAEIIGQRLGLGVIISENLREQDFGLWEGKRMADIRRATPGLLEHQERLGWDFCPPGGETRKEVLVRSLGALGQAAEELKGLNLLVVTHSGVIRSLAYHALGRFFLPWEKRVLKKEYLHEFVWSQGLTLKKLNAMDLNRGEG
ncbi:MAG: histidine phosphatase family protein [Desulfobacterium sp.]|nr:histidine phosphatase family protein [Desulfobacterium sp.]